MYGIIFGKELRSLRVSKGISTKELSKLIGKGHAYISQLESGKIKKPDYDTCYYILQQLGLPPERIEQILGRFQIKSQEQEQEELADTLHRNSNLQNIIFDTNILAHSWFTQDIEELKEYNHRIYSKLEVFISHDFSTANKVIRNIDRQTTDRDDFYFFCTINSHNYSALPADRRNELAKFLSDFMANAI